MVRHEASKPWGQWCQLLAIINLWQDKFGVSCQLRAPDSSSGVSDRQSEDSTPVMKLVSLSKTLYHDANTHRCIWIEIMMMLMQEEYSLVGIHILRSVIVVTNASQILLFSDIYNQIAFKWKVYIVLFTIESCSRLLRTNSFYECCYQTYTFPVMVRQKKWLTSK